MAAIGIFDSGSGGLSVYRELVRRTKGLICGMPAVFQEL